MAAGVRHRLGGHGPAASLTPARARRAAPAWGRFGLLAVMPALGIVRAELLRTGVPDVVAGSAFAACLLAVALLGGTPRLWPVTRRVGSAGTRGRARVGPGEPAGVPVPAALAAGAAVGSLLAGVGAWLGHPHPAGAHWVAGGDAWVAATLAVVVAEELFLRGWVQPLLRRAFGAVPAVWLVAVAFALAHVPLYGLQALPLDLGVGVALGLLREWSGRVSPSVVAHGIADLAWWVFG